MTPPRRTAPRRSVHTRASGANPTDVLLEDIRAQLGVVLEAVQGCATKSELAEFREDVARRFEAVDARFDRVGADLRSLRKENARKAESATLAALDLRVTALERRVGT